MYARWTGTNWETQDTDIRQMITATLALDNSDNPHIACTDGYNEEYASRVQSKWITQTVDYYYNSPVKISLAFDKSNTPYILYPHSIDGTIYQKLKVVHLENSNWIIQNFTFDVSDFSNIVLDSQGYPHFTCQEQSPQQGGSANSTLFYASWDGTDWITEPVVSQVYIDSIGSLVLDSEDNPHIFYILPAPEGKTQTLYATRTGAGWVYDDVNSSRPTAGRCYLTVDSYGNPHVSYRLLGGTRFTTPLVYANATGQLSPIQTPLPTEGFSISPDVIIVLGVSAVLLAALVSIAFYRARPNTSKRSDV